MIQVFRMQCTTMTKIRDEVESQGHLQFVCRGPALRMGNFGLVVNQDTAAPGISQYCRGDSKQMMYE